MSERKRRKSTSRFTVFSWSIKNSQPLPENNIWVRLALGGLYKGGVWDQETAIMPWLWPWNIVHFIL
jgi:hypothetical protein